MSDNTPKRHSAGLLDIRNIIGALLFLYGVVLVIVGAVDTSQAELDKADGINANVWVGIVLLVVGVLFAAWARTRPIVVDEEELARDRAEVEKAAGRGGEDSLGTIE